MGQSRSSKRAKATKKSKNTPLNNLDQPLVQPTLPAITEFTRFRALSPELRLRVYDFMKPGRRLICIGWNIKSGYLTTMQVPAVLHVDRESRQHLLKTYHLMTFQNNRNLTLIAPKVFNCYIDFNRDLLFLNKYTFERGFTHNADAFLLHMGADTRSRIRHLALSLWNLGETQTIPGLSSLRLRTLSLLNDDSDWYYALNKPLPQYSWAEIGSPGHTIWILWSLKTLPKLDGQMKGLLRVNGTPEDVVNQTKVGFAASSKLSTCVGSEELSVEFEYLEAEF